MSLHRDTIRAETTPLVILAKPVLVYILASRRNGTLYIGVTNDLIRRVYEHKSDFIKGFTEKYGVHMLVYYEECDSAESAFRREKQLKVWHRKWKIRLIEEKNPEWQDLYEEVSS
ncbi:MAG: GIY-YIG nuclease family protein [Chloroflexi bacterium]|nr:GIY-YIG nuclease family protein [Chloroflexota bacterium]